MRSRWRYCAYGKERNGTSCTSGNGLPTDRHFTGQFYDDTGLHYYNARYYDDHLGQFISPDTIVPDATSVFDYNRFMMVRGRVLNANDPTGHRLYFAAGAGHDPDNTGYPQMMVSVFADAGIANPADITAHGNKWSDIAFTIGDNSRYQAGETIPYVTFATREEILPSYGVYSRPVDWRVSQAVDEMTANLKSVALEDGEQLNLIGYSTGSVIMAQSALQMANNGYVIDNLVLVGTPILSDSELFQSLQGNSNIRNIIRVDIPDDGVATMNQGPLSLVGAGIGFAIGGNEHPHFRYAFGENAKQYSGELAAQLMEQGVR